jgi:phosphoribosylformylglycinamidine synthase
MKLRIDVMLKNGVLDPQGKAVGHALGTLGFTGIEGVRVGKVIELNTAETDPQKATAQATEMAEKLLANLVIEDYRIAIVA